ncbi:dolichol-phosphate mannosyltransferase subunit 3 [Sitophilus oryzae]|uniref:Dolichol-phosphate mannosyltransferase subunit 3 n=1 Tax=Sitophilus oryzae TaxID=7048 RepID=A0A6J2Y1X9_SITOR|nr:dolichol-phosphate mannosyltransferase subunit 3 [Sitophilus oryzae]
MTKLMEWIFVAGALGAIWLALLTNKIENIFVKDYYQLLLFSPIIFIVLFGIYALIIVLYRVFTFNNCNEAADELQKEIQEAKVDLQRQGFYFKEH